jgi:signal peptidase I
VAYTNKDSRSNQFTQATPGFFSSLTQFAFLLLLIFAIRTVIFGLYQVPTGSMETTMLVGERFLADKLSYWFRTPKRGEIIAFNDPNFEYSKNGLVNWFQRYVYGPTNLTKRVIGIPGDHVKGVIENGKPVIYLNGVKLEEPYLNKNPLIAVKSKDGRIDFRSYDPHYSLDKQPYYKLKPESIVRVNGEPALRYPGTPLQRGEDIFDVKLGKNEYWAMGDNRLGSWDSRGWGILDGKLIHGRILLRLWSSDSTEDWWIVDLLKHPIDFWKRIRWQRSFQALV